MRLLELDANEERSKPITMNLLEKSGLRGNRPERDANMIQDSIYEAAHQLRNDSLKDALDRHFDLNYLDDKARENQADGCTIAALLLMNAAMLHQRISAGRWLDGVESLDVIKNSNNPVSEIKDQWNTIRARDFRPVIEPALEAIRAMERTGRTGGLVKAVRHIAKEAEELAASYADLGADHAGPLFNRVMGNQASDGAYFTRPVAASIAARLPLDALGEQDWTDEETWKVHKTVDLASSNEGDVVLDPFCGCGTAIAAAERLNRRWIGIDITHIAITLIRHRLHDAFKDELKPIAPQGIILEMPLSFLVSRFCPSTGRFRTRAVLTAGRNRGHKFRPS